MTTLLAMWLLLSGLSSAPGDTLDLDEAYRAAWRNFPAAAQLPLHDEIARIRREDIRARFNPSVSAGAQVLYHSDVVKFPFQVPGSELPEVARDQYRASLDLNQVIFDGGAASSQARLETAAARLARDQVEADFHKIKEQVNGTYFSALIQDAVVASLSSLQEEVQERRRALEARVRQGAAPAAATAALEVELLRIDQQLAEARRQRGASVAVLEILTGLELEDDAALAVPALAEGRTAAGALGSARPEHEVFRASRERLELQKALAGSRHRPTVSATASFAYGRPPGLNLFENELTTFYSMGLQIRVPLFRSSARDRAVLDLQKQILDSQEEAFSQAVAAAAERELHDVLRLETLLEMDQRIIHLRKQIADRARGQLELGEISATEYLLEQHALHHAELTFERRRIELHFAGIRYLTTLGLTQRTDETRDSFR